MRKELAVAIAAALTATAGPASAVVLGARGTGQVLIYPYYTVNHQQTLVSVVNTAAHGKALKVRFREGYDGRDVANFNVYLGPYDSWVGAVFDTSSDGTGPAAIATNDNSCTVPAFPLAPVPGTLHALTFSNANYSQGDYGTPTGTDHGPTNLARTREGFLEIIEMGEVVDQASGSPKTLEAITNTAQPPGCAQVQSAWAANGYWTMDANTDLLPPAGGVYGAAGIVNVAQGTLYAFDATAIDAFSDVIQHTGPGNPKPNLATAVTDSARDIATAYVPIGHAMVKADYPASTRGIDAVSAVLTTRDLVNEFTTETGVGARSEFLVAFPTKQFYVDPGIVGMPFTNAIAPFGEVFGDGFSTPAASCTSISWHYFDRMGNQSGIAGCGFPECPITQGNYLCYETPVITFNQAGAEPGVPTAIFASLLALNVPTIYDAGWFDLEFPDPVETIRPSIQGQVFRGLPAVGFVAIDYVNANVTPGVLSNYSGAHSHRVRKECVDAGSHCQ